MGLFAMLDACQRELLSDYFAANMLMGDAQLAELAAAQAIQTCAKGFLVRSRLRRIARAALAIQKVWRGFLGRKRFQYFRSCRNRVVRQAYFHLAATTIQRWFRGFCSRKYCHSVAARRRYLQTVSLKSAAIREEAQAEAAAAKLRAAADAEEKQRADFVQQASKMHHLVGTRAQPGVFMSPAQLLMGTTPTFDGAPVEDHLRVLSRRTVSLPPLRRRRQPLQSQMCMAHLLEAELLGDAQRRTLQSLPHYDRPRHEAAIAHESHKSTVRALHGYAFEATGGARPRLPLSVATGSSLRCMEPWMEPNIARVEGKVPGLDASAKKVGKRLFQSTCQRHRSFGRTLRAGEGV